MLWWYAYCTFPTFDILWNETQFLFCKVQISFGLVLQNTISLDNETQSNWFELNLGVTEGCSKLDIYLAQKILWNVRTNI